MLQTIYAGGTIVPLQERIPVGDALRAVTGDAAGQLSLDEVGRLEVGARADLVVLSADPRRVPPEELARIEVAATALGGGLTKEVG